MQDDDKLHNLTEGRLRRQPREEAARGGWHLVWRHLVWRHLAYAAPPEVAGTSLTAAPRLRHVAYGGPRPPVSRYSVSPIIRLIIGVSAIRINAITVVIANRPRNRV